MNEYLLDTLRRYGKLVAETVQAKAPQMTGTELNGEEDFLPDFVEAVKRKNMLQRKPGFVCRSSEGRVVRLIQPYDSTTFPGEPETLGAQWGFVWSHDPAHARPFAALATSPYGKGDVCTWEGKTLRSKVDGNVFPPDEYPDGWEAV